MAKKLSAFDQAVKNRNDRLGISPAARLAKSAKAASSSGGLRAAQAARAASKASMYNYSALGGGGTYGISQGGSGAKKSSSGGGGGGRRSGKKLNYKRMKREAGAIVDARKGAGPGSMMTQMRKADQSAMAARRVAKAAKAARG